MRRHVKTIHNSQRSETVFMCDSYQNPLWRPQRIQMWLLWRIIYSFAKLERSYQNHSWSSQILQNKGPVHFRKSILGKFFVRRFYSRHISSWHNFSGKFIVWRFYSSRNNRTPKLSFSLFIWKKRGKQLFFSYKQTTR